MVPRIAFDVDRLRADIEAGRTHAAIAKEYGCSTRAVGDAVRRAGIIRPERHLQARHPELVDRAWLQRKYVDKRRGLGDVGRQFGCDSSTIRAYLVRLGMPTRGQASDSMPRELRDRDWLEAAYADRPAEAIARELGVGATALRRAMRNLGVEVDTNRSR